MTILESVPVVASMARTQRVTESSPNLATDLQEQKQKHNLLMRPPVIVTVEKSCGVRLLISRAQVQEQWWPTRIKTYFIIARQRLGRWQSAMFGVMVKEVGPKTCIPSGEPLRKEAIGTINEVFSNSRSPL